MTVSNHHIKNVLLHLRYKNDINLILCVQINLSCALHGAEEVTELNVDLLHKLL